MSKLEDLRWVIIAPEAEVIKWTKAFNDFNENISLEVGPNISSPETVDVLLLWNHPKGSLLPFTNAKIYYSLGAGVDHLVNDPKLYPQVPISRIVDPLLSFSMSNYILFAVLYYQRKWSKFQQDQRDRKWDHDGPAERTIKVGVLGMGTLGSDAAKKLKFMGFPVVGYSPTKKTIEGIITFCEGELNSFLNACNVLVCTVPYTDQTHGLLSKTLFEQCCQSTYLINVSRGGVQVENDIIDALDTGKLSGAFLDVFEQEPLPKNSPLWEHPKVNITPHIASITNPMAGVKQIIENVNRLLKNKELLHTVNKSKGY